MTTDQPFRSCHGCVGMLLESIGMIALSVALIVGALLCPLAC